ncbi:hypothetical protein GYY_03035 [Methanococcus maripaludis X1]|uniref:Uncharacterized protein n=1 Tax=Methanococcus maripaludis X1 TaxID=1053692 RepID=G0H420_METMI|nr:hypothetical protein [Methanococcus maripaludis]AEK19486.1 hypothetical protein GYY_03035 [Methanococcus maripaludis X1]
MNKKLTLLLIFCVIGSMCPVSAFDYVSSGTWYGPAINFVIDIVNLGDVSSAFDDSITDDEYEEDSTKASTMNQSEADEAAVENAVGTKQTATEDMMESIQYIRDSVSQEPEICSVSGDKQGGLTLSEFKVANNIHGFSLFPVEVTVTTPRISTELEDVEKTTGEIDGESYSLDIKGYTNITRVTFQVVQGDVVVSQYVLDDLEVSSESSSHTFTGILKTPDDSYQEISSIVDGGLVTVSQMNSILNAQTEDFEVKVIIDHTIYIWEEQVEHATWDMVEHEDGEKKPDKYPEKPTDSWHYDSIYTTRNADDFVKTGQHPVNGYESGLSSEYEDIFGSNIYPFKTDSNGAVNNFVVPLYASMIHEFENPARFRFKVLNYPENLLPYSDTSQITGVKYRLVAINYHMDGTCSLSFDSRDSIPTINESCIIDKVIPYTADNDTVEIYTYLIITGRIYDIEADQSYPVWYIARPKISVRSNYVSITREHSKQIDEFLTDDVITWSESDTIEELFESDIATLHDKKDEAEEWQDKNEIKGSSLGVKYSKLAAEKYQDAISSLTGVDTSDVAEVRTAKTQAYLYEVEANDYLEAAKKCYYGAEDTAEILVSQYEEENDVTFGLAALFASDMLDEINDYLSFIPYSEEINTSVPGGMLTVIVLLCGAVIVFRPKNSGYKRRWK